MTVGTVGNELVKALSALGLGWTFLRPNGFMENLPSFVGATIKSQGAFYLPSRGCRISHVDVPDADFKRAPWRPAGPRPTPTRCSA